MNTSFVSYCFIPNFLKIMKTKTLTILFLILTFSIRAQEKGSTIYFNIGSGMHSLSYSTPYAASKGTFGFTKIGRAHV